MRSMFKKIFFLFFLFPFYSSAQNRKVDSLQKAHHFAKADSTKLRLRMELAGAVKDFRMELWDSIYVAVKEKGTKLMEANCLNVIGTINRNTGNISKAVDNYISYLKIMQDLNDKPGIVSATNNLGIVYRTLGDTVKAIEYHLRALKLATEINAKDEMSGAYNSLAIIEKTRNNFDKALDYYAKSLAIRIGLKDKFGIAEINFNMGMLYKSRKEMDKAKDYLNKSYELFKEINDNQGMNYSLNFLAAIYLREGDLGQAEKLSKAALKLGNETGFPKMIRNPSQMLFKIYSANKKYKEALEMHLLYIKMRDSVNNEDLREASIRATMKFEYDKRTSADSLRVAKEKELVAIQLKQEETQRYALYGGLVLTLFFGGFIFNRFRITRKQNKIIAEQKKEVEQKNKEVMDSIQYAKRIQQSLLPTEKYIDKNIKRLND